MAKTDLTKGNKGNEEFLTSFPLFPFVKECQTSDIQWVDRRGRLCQIGGIRMNDPVISAESPMRDVLIAFPGAQRALFRRYHIGGCSSCGFSPEETLAGVCARNGNLNVAEVLEHIRSSHELDVKVLISAPELAALLAADKKVKVVDVRSREEFEAVHIPGSVLLSQDVMREVMGGGSNTQPVVVVDHQGKNGLDAAAYFMGHGLSNVRCLRGGIDAWAQEVDTTMRRYRVG